MKLLPVSPGWPKGRLWGELGPRFPSLSLAAIAAATPAGWEVLLCDENLEPLNLEADDGGIRMSAVPRARRDTYSGRNYLLTNTFPTTRGCPHDCEFCSVTSSMYRRITRVRGSLQPIGAVNERFRNAIKRISRTSVSPGA